MIKGNTQFGKSAGYEFELKTRKGSSVNSNTEMYHVLLTKKIDEVVGDDVLTREHQAIRLYTESDYRDLFIEKITKANGKEVYRHNTDWLKNFKRMDGSQGHTVLFDPKIYAKEENSKEPEVIEFNFTNKSEVMQANKASLKEFCEKNNLESDGKNINELKSEVIEFLNF